MSKGPSQAGNITQTTVNPTQQAQLPFLSGGWNTARDLGTTNPLTYYPGQTLASFNPNVAGGYNALSGAGNSIYGSLFPNAQGTATNAMNGGFGVGNSPAYASLSSEANLSPNSLAAYLANLGGQAAQTGANLGGQFQNFAQSTGAGGYAGNIAGYGSSAAANPFAGLLSGMATGSGNGQTAALAGLSKTAAGDFLNKNPYIDAQYRAASDPVTRQYMTATAPQTDSNYEASGRYGSGALVGARGQNEQNLGKTLGDLSANMYGQDYANERGLMTSAQGVLGNLGLGEYTARGQMANMAGNQYLSGLNSAIGANQAAGNLGETDYANRLSALKAGADATNSGYATGGGLLGNAGTLSHAGASTLQSGYQGGNTAALQALGLAPSVAGLGATGAGDITAGGTGLTGIDQSQIADQMARFYGNQQAPWKTLQQQMNLFGQPTSGSNSITTPVLGPNTLSSILGTGMGLNSLFGGGSGSLFGSNGAFGSGGALSSLFGGGGGAGDMGSLAALAGDFGGGGDGLAAGGSSLLSLLGLL